MLTLLFTDVRRVQNHAVNFINYYYGTTFCMQQITMFTFETILENPVSLRGFPSFENIHSSSPPPRCFNCFQMVYLLHNEIQVLHIILNITKKSQSQTSLRCVENYAEEIKNYDYGNEIID